MSTLKSRSTDPAHLAASIRTLAAHAHHVLNDPSPHPTELLALLRRVDRLESQAADWPTDELSRWLASARRRIESGKRGPAVPHLDVE